VVLSRNLGNGTGLHCVWVPIGNRRDHRKWKEREGELPWDQLLYDAVTIPCPRETIRGNCIREPGNLEL
jgi:hypothetical protein